MILDPEDKKIFESALDVLEEGKAENPVLMDMKELTTMADYFLIAHGNNTRQVQALADHLQEKLRSEFKIVPHHIEGLGKGQWVLMDYGYFIVHLFLEEKREYYSLERIWMDAPRISP